MPVQSSCAPFSAATMLAFLNLSVPEVVTIAVVAVLVFGRRLPEVAGQAAGVVQRMRRSIEDLRRESGIDRELRNARRKFDQAVPRDTRELGQQPESRADQASHPPPGETSPEQRAPGSSKPPDKVAQPPPADGPRDTQPP